MDPVHEHSLFADFFNRNELLNLSPLPHLQDILLGGGRWVLNTLDFSFF